MSNKKISQFQVVTTLNGTTYVPVIQGSPLFDAIISASNFASSMQDYNDNYYIKVDGTNSDIDYLNFNPDAVGNPQPYVRKWDATEGTFVFGLPDGGIIQEGKELFDYYVNADTVPLVNGDIVSIVPIGGNRKAVARTNVTNAQSAKNVIGMVTVASIAVGATGRITKFGEVHDLQTQLYPDGTELFVSQTNAGKWATVAPTPPNYTVKIGTVIVSQNGNGIVELGVQCFPKLGDLSDVNGVESSVNKPIVRKADGVIDAIDNLTLASIAKTGSSDAEVLLGGGGSKTLQSIYDESAGVVAQYAGEAEQAAIDAEAAKLVAQSAKDAAEAAQLAAESAEATALANNELLGGIAYNASAPTPGKSGKYSFTTGGSCTWLTGGAATVAVGDEVVVVYTAPSTYTYTRVPRPDVVQSRGRGTSVSISQNKMTDELIVLESAVRLKLQWTTGYYYDSNLNIVSNANNSISDKIRVNGSKTINTNANASPIVYCGFFDVNGAFISTFNVNGTSTNITTPANAYWLVLTNRSADKPNSTVTLTSTDGAFADLKNYIDNEITRVTGLIPQTTENTGYNSNLTVSQNASTILFEKILSSFNKIDKTRIIKGQAVIDTGDIINSGSYARSPYIKLNPSTTYCISGWTTAAGTKGFFFGVNYAKISVVSLTAVTGGYKFTTPSNAVYVIFNFDYAETGNTAQLEKGTSVTAYKAFELAYEYSPITDSSFYWKQKQLSPLRNLHNNVLPFIKGFLSAYGNYSSQQYQPNTIVMLGDSLFAFTHYTDSNGIDATKNPPTMGTRNVPAAFWENLKTKPDYFRFDATSIFTETGVFTTVSGYLGLTQCDDNGDRDLTTRYSASASATIAFQIAASYKGCNFIDRTATDGAENTVSISQGNGYLEVKDSNGNWVEANGYIISQLQVANATLLIGNTKYQRRVYFRKTALHIADIVNVTITKDSSANKLYYWGIEAWKYNNYIQLINSARGGHTLENLKPYLQTDVYDRNPKLVILEIPMPNILNYNSSFAYSLNTIQDFIFGDRTGSENTWNLKTKSNNWQDFQLVCYLPHFRQSYYNSDGSYAETAQGHTYRQVYDAVKSYLISRDIYVIDMEEVFNEESVKNTDLLNPYNGVSSTGSAGLSYTNDTVHLNNNGVKIWKEHSIFL